MLKNKRLEKLRKKVTGDIKRFNKNSFAISDRIDEILKEKNMTHRELAQKLGKSEAEISKWMRGNHNFTLRTLSKIEDAVDADLISVTGKEQEVLVKTKLFVMNAAQESTLNISSVRKNVTFNTNKAYLFTTGLAEA